MVQPILKTPTEQNSLHVAIIMDGNGRWAKARGLPRTAGHKRGAEAVRKTIRGAVSLGITHLTLFGFSSENWQRPQDEVSDLMGLLRFYLKNEIKKLHKEGVQVRFIGDRSRLSRDIVEMISDSESLTSDNTKLVLTIALSYGSRAEITNAARRLSEKVQSGELRPEDITEAALSAELYTADMPDPDLVIRTSGEQRVSNFLLWQVAYAEFLFQDVFWPDYNETHLKEALEIFQGRDRRFGQISV